MMTFEKVLEVFNDYLNKDSVLEVVNTKRGYTVMIWDEKDEQWFGVEHCKAPELLRDALLDGYRDFLEQQLTHNRRSLTETEILDIQNRCEQLYDLCGELSFNLNSAIACVGVALFSVGLAYENSVNYSAVSLAFFKP